MKHTVAGWSSDISSFAIDRNGEIVALIEFPIFRSRCGIRFCLFDDDLLNGGSGLGLGLVRLATGMELPGDELLLEEKGLCTTPCLADSIV